MVYPGIVLSQEPIVRNQFEHSDRIKLRFTRVLLQEGDDILFPKHMRIILGRFIRCHVLIYILSQGLLVALLPRVQEDLILEEPFAFVDAFQDRFRRIFGVRIPEESPHLLELFGELRSLEFFLPFLLYRIEDSVEVEQQQFGVVGLDFCFFVDY